MHPILAQPARIALYLGAWLIGGSLLAATLSLTGGAPWSQAIALALPLSVFYAFVCLGSYYACQAMPPERSSYFEIVGAHGLAAVLSSLLWVAAGLVWATLLDRLAAFNDTMTRYRELIVLFVVVGLLLYVLAVVIHYLLIAFEASRDAESRNLELQVKAREAELAAVQARREQELAERELELARAMQRRLLPPPELDGPGYRVSARNVPANFVAGDFYDVFRLADGNLGLVVADVAGKGIGASLITASVKAMTPLIAADHPLAETLHRLNQKLCSELGRREFVALALALFDPATGDLQIANCGLPDPYLLRNGSQRALELPGTRLPLGVRDDISYDVLRLRLDDGDRLLLLTDGLPETLAANDEPLGYERLAELIALARLEDTPSLALDRLLADISREGRGINDDDLTALMLERVSTEARDVPATPA